MTPRRTLPELKREIAAGGPAREVPPRALCDAENGADRMKVFAFLLAALLFVAAIFGVRVYFERNYFIVDVSGSSMEHTIQSGDVVYARRTSEAERGDIVIVDTRDYHGYNLGPDSYTIIKRLIAVEGDKIKCEGGVVYLAADGKEYEALREPYVNGGMREDFGEIVLGKDEIFVMGDNRPDSRDSRASGPFLRSDILGVVADWSVESRKFFSAWERLRKAVSDFIETYVLFKDG